METLTPLDLVLAPTLMLLTAALLHVRDLFASIVLFIVFGVLMAATWVRLDAVDIAIAEAALGAGVTGALLLRVFGELRRRRGAPDEARATRRQALRNVAAAVLVVPVALFLGYAVLSLPAERGVLGPLVARASDEAGATHAVTAVLLAYRAYDTLLELAVLLLVAIGVWALRLPADPVATPPGAVLRSTVRWLVPVGAMIGGYLLWRGTRGPGGAFQAGAVLAGVAILAYMADPTAWPRGRRRALRGLLVAGVALFGGIGVVATLVGEPFLFYRGGTASSAIWAIEVAATVSIAVALVAVFIGRAPAGEDA